MRPPWDGPPRIAVLIAVVCAGCAPAAKPAAPAPAAPAVERSGLATPVHLRPCCVFGQGLKPAATSWPGFESGNVRGIGDLGPHGYDSGLVNLAGVAQPRAVDEKNGLVYTCRGGFVDVAQVRDSADMTAFLAAAIEPRLQAGGAVALADDGGTRYVLVHPVEKRQLEIHGRRALAVDVGGWLAFQVAVWRQIVEWYEGGWAGKVAAFSPEDSYSSRLGIELAQQILRGGEPPGTAAAFERAMDERLPETLAALGAVSADSARAAMKAVDGRWWDSQRSASEAGLVSRRRFDLWGRQVPWLVCDAYRGRRCPYRDCGARPAPLALDNPVAGAGVDFAGVATLEIEVAGALAARGFPFPRDDSDTITQAEFAAIVEKIRRTEHRKGAKGMKAL